jgi:RNA polymerase sigma factor (sigma-70 family)
MPDANDMDLVREFARDNSETAFTELVRRYINLVYSVALRYTRNAEDAQDVAQAVFIILAQKAAALRPKIIFTGWLYETTRFTAMNFLTAKSVAKTANTRLICNPL